MRGVSCKTKRFPLKKLTYGVLAGLTSLILVTLPLNAQEAVQTTEDESPGSNTGWQPSSGSLFGGAIQQQGGSGEVLNGAIQRSEASVEDVRPELLAFKLLFAEGVNFSDSYLERFQATYREALEAGGFNVLGRRIVRQRMRDAAVLSGGRPDVEQAQQIADRIEVSNWLHAIVDIADRRNYEIIVTRGASGQEQDEWTVCSERSNRRIDTVDRTLKRVLEACLVTEELRPAGSAE